MDEGKAISKPKDAEVGKEEAVLSGKIELDDFGLPKSSDYRTPEQ